MKKNFYLLGFWAASLTFTGCSDELESKNPEDVVNSGEVGYVKIAINLPTVSGMGTRAAAGDGTDTNDQFEDGEENEYAVENAIIAFFKGNQGGAEGDATFVTAKSIDDLTRSSTGTDNNITSSYSYTLDGIPKVEADKQMYAFVILNNNGLFSADNGNLKFGSANISTFSDLQGESYTVTSETDASKFITDGFLMCNAPIANCPSVPIASSFSPVVTTLAKVTVYTNDPTHDSQVTADPVYVERAVAKVEVKVSSSTDGSLSVTDNVGTVIMGHKVQFTQWALNVTNKSSKIVRDVTYYSAWAGYFNSNVTVENRFFGTTAGPYRVYWAIDTNYSANQKDDFNHFSESNTATWKPISTTSTPQYDYCFENTMVADQQIQGFNTGVLLEGKYQIGDDEDADVFTLGTSSAGYSTKEMLDAINKIVGETGKYEFNTSIEGEVIGNAGTEEEKIKQFQTAFKLVSDHTTSMTEEDAKKLIEDSYVGTINYYKGGRTYYWSRPIKHFGDYYTPLYNDNGEPVDFYDQASDYNDNDHLGRYGVVRNNWYQLNITSVSGPGYPTIPEIPTGDDNPDDSGTGYVKMNINVLSWAVRQQDIEL